MKWIKFSVVALFAAAFIGLILYVVFMQDSIRSSNVEPPLIVAPEQAVKRRPDQPGGMQIPNQDKLVFDLLDTSGTEQVEPEEMAVANVAADDGREVVAEVEEISATEVMAREEPKPVVVSTSSHVVAPVKTVAPVEVAAAVELKKVEEPKVEAKVAAGGWGVQLASVKAKADADAALKKLANQFSALRSLEGRVQSANVNGATSYRIQFVGAATRDEAASICKALGSKQPCFPVKK